jgi:4-aminobutyrate aminotransferase
MSQLYARDGAVISAAEKLRFFPLAVTGGDGSHLVADGGRRLLDLSGSWGAASLGYSHPALADAVSGVLRNMPAASILSLTNEPAVRFAERLRAIVPGDTDRRVWLGHSGSDANEAAIRILQGATGRNGIIAFEGAYHGGTTGSMAVSAHLAQEGVDKHPGLHLLAYPDPYRGGAASGDDTLAQLDRLLAHGCDPADMAALLLEPIMSDGGMIVPPAGFVSALADRCHAHGILLLCDEVKVGLGRTGWLHAFQAEGVEPDIVTFGKGIGGGIPLSAAVGPADLFDTFTAFAMQTTCGNPVSATAGLAVLDTIEREGLVARSRELGVRMVNGLTELQSDSDVIGDIRGRGLAIGVDLVSDRAARTAAGDLAAKVAYRAFELGAVVFCIGMEANVLELTPPLILTDEEADRGVELIGQAITDALDGRVSDAEIAAFSGW